MNKLSWWIGIGATIVVLFTLSSASAGAQEYTCMGCNQLTDRCDPNAPGGISAYCYESEVGGEPYCHAYGDPELEVCPERIFVQADGVPVFRSDIIEREAVELAEGLLVAKDCRGRVWNVTFSPAKGKESREQLARIVI